MSNLTLRLREIFKEDYVIMVPNRLYKYINPERLSVLEEGLIRFTQPSALNDPFEIDVYFHDLFDEAEVSNQIISMDIEGAIEQAVLVEMVNNGLDKLSRFEKRRVKESIKKGIRNRLEQVGIDGFKQMILDKSKKEKESIQAGLVSEIQNRIGILSLTEDALSPPMWGNYADSSKGIVIGFNSQHSFFNRKESENDELRHLRKVIYEDRPAAKTLMTIDKDIMIIKKESWSYEKEWRILLPLDQPDKKVVTSDGDVICLFKYPREMVAEIIFGINTSETTKIRILHCIENFDRKPIIQKVVKKGSNLVLERIL